MTSEKVSNLNDKWQKISTKNDKWLKIFQEIENSNSMMRLEPKLAGENCIKYWFNKVGWRTVHLTALEFLIHVLNIKCKKNISKFYIL